VTASSDTTQREPVRVQVTRAFAASPERVFDAWLDPEQARRFLFATADGEMTRVEIDARVGGRFCIVERRGDEDAEHHGAYLEIDRPRRLVFSFGTSPDLKDADVIVIEIVSTATGCELTLTHDMKPEWAEWAERTRQGWAGIVDGLSTLLLEN
jgi:uncharacterized protein YndB with AHSA1/START domain